MKKQENLKGIKITIDTVPDLKTYYNKKYGIGYNQFIKQYLNYYIILLLFMFFLQMF